MTTGRRWRLARLPGQQEAPRDPYEFYIGPCTYISSDGLYLHIPEIGARDAEGRPQHPEQAAWIDALVGSGSARAKSVWWSHWEFASEADARAFERLLESVGATRMG